MAGIPSRLASLHGLIHDRLAERLLHDAVHRRADGGQLGHGKNGGARKPPQAARRRLAERDDRVEHRHDQGALAEGERSGGVGDVNAGTDSGSMTPVGGGTTFSLAVGLVIDRRANQETFRPRSRGTGMVPRRRP